MLFKILTCSCFIGTFHSEGFNKKLIHFHCKCKTYPIREKHKLFVLFCENHPFGGKKGAYSHQHKECTCINESVDDICKYCDVVSYILNFWSYKFCVERTPQIFEDKVVPLDTYLQKLKCMPFFTFNSKNNSIKTSLDNPFEPKIADMTGEF